jgi:hypothetical protein
MGVEGAKNWDLDRRVESLERRLAELEELYRNVAVELGGVPDEIGRDPARPSIRRRLHILEDERAATALTETAMKAAMKLHDASKEKRFSKREKMVALSFSLVIAAGSWITPFLYHP